MLFACDIDHGDNHLLLTCQPSLVRQSIGPRSQITPQYRPIPFLSKLIRCWRPRDASRCQSITATSMMEHR